MADLLSSNFSQFSDRVTRAAEDGNLKAEPLIRALDNAFKAALGVEVVLRMIEANDALTGSEPENVPLSPFATGALNGLAIFAMQAVISEIEGVAEWAGDHGVKEDRHE